MTIVAVDGPGLFYGTQTLLQLLPPQIFAPAKAEGEVAWAVPAVRIEDQPRFRWRGLLLDVARHFFSKQEVENFIDLMAQHKLNTLQLHLTDNEGWRIEIKRYPKLTAVSAWRTGDPWLGTKYPADKPYGGFFTQDDIREIVAYAKARYVNVVPEIEMPAHAGGAIAAYPEISCTGRPAGRMSVRATTPRSSFWRACLRRFCRSSRQVHPRRRRRGVQGRLEEMPEVPGAHEAGRPQERRRTAKLFHSAHREVP